MAGDMLQLRREGMVNRHIQHTDGDSLLFRFTAVMTCRGET